MTKAHGTWIVVLLAAMLAIAAHRSYFRKATPTRWEYKVAEGDKIDVADLQSAGAQGWECSVVPTSEGSAHRYIVFCKRPAL